MNTPGYREEVERLQKEESAELEYLRWYRENIDFGPAHEDVIAILDEQYTDETGNEVPVGWREEDL